MENGVKKWINQEIVKYVVDLRGWSSGICFHELALGANDGIIGHYFLELHKAKVHYYDKKFECIDDEGMVRNIHGEKIHIAVK